MADDERNPEAEPREDNSKETKNKKAEKPRKEGEGEVRAEQTRSKEDRAKEIAQRFDNLKRRREDFQKLQEKIIQERRERIKAGKPEEREKDSAVDKAAKSLEEETKKLIGEARGALSPDLQEVIDKQLEQLQNKVNQGEEVDLATEQQTARRIELEGEENNEPIKEVAGKVLLEEIRELGKEAGRAEVLRNVRAEMEEQLTPEKIEKAAQVPQEPETTAQTAETAAPATNEQKLALITELREKQTELNEAAQKLADAQQTFDSDEPKFAAQVKETGRELLEVVQKAEPLFNKEEKDQVDKMREKYEQGMIKHEKPDFSADLTQAAKLVDQGKKENDPGKELCGEVLKVEVKRLADFYNSRHPEETSSPEEIKAREEAQQTQGLSFREIQQRLKDLKQQEPTRDNIILETKLEAERDNAVKNALSGDQLKEAQSEVTKWREMAGKGVDARLLAASMAEAVKKAEERDEAKLTSGRANPDAGMESFYLKSQFDQLFKSDSVRKDTQYENIEGHIQELRHKLSGAGTREEAETMAQELAQYLGQRGQREAQMVREMEMSMGAGGRGFYEQPPTDPDKLQNWVLSKMSEIENAKVSPSILIYFPAYTSLLYAMPKLPMELREQVGAWRSAYEFSVNFYTAAGPKDLLGLSSLMTSETFKGLIGQQKDGKFTDVADLVQEAFVRLEKRGAEMMSPTIIKDGKVVPMTGQDRNKIHEEITEELKKIITEKMRANPSWKINPKFADFFEKTAYKYWQAMARESHFDHVYYSEDGEDGKIFHSVSPETDQKIANLPFRDEKGRPVSKRYNSWGGNSKFFIRRLLNAHEDLRQEKNIRFLTPMFDNLDYSVWDYAADSFFKNDKGKLKKTDSQVTKEMFGRVNWEDDTTGYSVWGADLLKAADSREMLIKVYGILDQPNLDTKKIMELKTVFDTYGNKVSEIMPELTRGLIESFKDRGFNLKVVPGVKGRFPHFRIYHNKVEELTGTPSIHLNRAKLEDFINGMVENSLVSEEAGEELKREYLGIGPIPGIGPVRGSIRFIEGVTNPKNIFSIFWTMFSTFMKVSIPEAGGGGGGGGGGKRK